MCQSGATIGFELMRERNYIILKVQLKDHIELFVEEVRIQLFIRSVFRIEMDMR